MLTDVCLRRGAFSHLPADRGGSTKFGLTQTTVTPMTGADIQTLTLEEACTIYHVLYVMRPGLDRLPPAIQPFLTDMALHSGPFIAIAGLQEVCDLTPDGVLNPMTIAAAYATSRLTDLIKWRLLMLTRIVRRDPTQLPMLTTWTAHVLDFLA